MKVSSFTWTKLVTPATEIVHSLSRYRQFFKYITNKQIDVLDLRPIRT